VIERVIVLEPEGKSPKRESVFVIWFAHSKKSSKEARGSGRLYEQLSGEEVDRGVSEATRGRKVL